MGVRCWVIGVGCWVLMSCGEEPTSNIYHPTPYQSPVNYDIVLAGNFGEPRPFHFHGGIDIKTDNQEGKEIFSIADGFVSRVTVNKYGFGGYRDLIRNRCRVKSSVVDSIPSDYKFSPSHLPMQNDVDRAVNWLNH